MAKRVDKPIRIYLITIFIVIAYGVLPLASAIPFGGRYVLLGPIFLPYNGSVQILYGPDGDVSLPLLLVTLVLSFFSVGSAIVAFFGVSEGRTSALIFITLDVAWWAFLVISAVVFASDRTDMVIRAVPELAIPPVWLAVIWWNYTRPDITAWLLYSSEVNS
jgi:hypothetical protein